MQNLIPLLIIVGPTAVGKTSISLALAEDLGGEIVSADSRYLYRGMDIGTAKPTADAMARAPHHLIDVTSPDQTWSLARYKRAATQAIVEINDRGRLPMLVGGTGQYVRAIVEGWEIPPLPDDPMLRRRLETTAGRPGGVAALHSQLTELDSRAANEINPRNVRRMVRALEVCISTGKPFSSQRIKQAPPYRMYILGLDMPRLELYTRIDARVDEMIKAGLVEEVHRLVSMGYNSDLPALSALGYPQIRGYLLDEYDLEEAVRLIKRDTRRFVRKQASWFSSKDRSIHWYDASATPTSMLEREIRRWLISRDTHA